MSQVTLSTAIREYTDLTHGRYAHGTRRAHASILGMFLRRVGDLQMRHLTQAHVERYFYAAPHGVRQRYAPGTFNQHRQVILGFIKFAINRGWLRTDPMFNVHRAKTVQKERLRLSAQDLLRALDTVHHPRDRAFLALAMNTGLRVSEIQTLTIGDLNLTAGTLHCTLTKNSKEDTFPVNADLDLELQRWLGYYRAQCGPLAPGWFLCPAKDNFGVNLHQTIDRGGLALKPTKRMGYPDRLLSSVFAQLGVADRTGEGVHTFRRSLARIYYDAMLTSSESRDDALRLTQALLNHSSVSVTEKYIGAARERERRDTSLKGMPFLTLLAAEGPPHGNREDRSARL